jgi:hypothetical protein
MKPTLKQLQDERDMLNARVMLAATMPGGQQRVREIRERAEKVQGWIDKLIAEVGR